MTEWIFEHSITTKASKEIAWDFLSDMSNQMKMEPGVERIELDGSFISGTKGRTITKDHTQEWVLSKVVEKEQFVLTGQTPHQDMELSFRWEFEDIGTGTQLTQHIKAKGPNIERYQDIFKGMEESTPPQMAKLATKLDGLAN